MYTVPGDTDYLVGFRVVRVRVRVRWFVVTGGHIGMLCVRQRWGRRR